MQLSALVKDEFPKLKDCHILVIGDVMLDHYLIGKSNRISPEAPVPIVDVTKEEHKLGGAANVALNIRNLGANVSLFGIVGDDRNGAILRKRLNQHEIENHNIVLVKNRPTTVKTRIVSNGKQLARVDLEHTALIENKLAKEIIAQIKFTIKEKNTNCIILQDYNKGVLNPFLISEIIEVAKQHSIKVLVDPKKENFFAYKNAFLFKPNLKEVQEGLGRTINPLNINHLNKAAQHLFDRLECENVVITLSENGVFFATRNGESKVVHQQKINVADVSGAGDTVIATLACALALQLDIESAIAIANLAALKVCQVAMVEPISLKMLL